jgi:hypothetical protein
MGNSSSNDLSNQINRSNEKIKNSFQNSLAQTARSVDRSNRAIDKSIKQTGEGFKKTFSKGNFEKFDDGLVHVFKDSGRILGEVSKVGDKLLNNPFTNVLGSIPILGEGIGALRLINTGVKVGGIVTGDLGKIADRHEYDKKNPLEVTKKVIDSSIKTGEDVGKTGIQFA